MLTFATDMCLVELVDAENRIITDGAVSARVLVTNLQNLTQPLIRYELTDRFERYPSLAGSGYARAEIGGRAEDVFKYGAVDVHPVVFDTVIIRIPSIVEYQVRQTASGVDVDVVARGDVDLAELASAIGERLRDAGLPRPKVTVGVVEAIARHPQTGKIRRFVSRTT